MIIIVAANSYIDYCRVYLSHCPQLHLSGKRGFRKGDEANDTWRGYRGGGVGGNTGEVVKKVGLGEFRGLGKVVDQIRGGDINYTGEVVKKVGGGRVNL